MTAGTSFAALEQTLQTMGFDTDLFCQQPVDANLLCNICQGVLEKPMVICENSHMFCEGCLSFWEQKSNSCPDCRNTFLPNKLIVRPIQNMILSLEVQCPEKKEGESNKRARTEESKDTGGAKASECECCDWKGTLSDYLEKHKDKTCKFGSVRCPLGCNKMVPVCDLETHKESECQKRLVKCDQCKEELCWNKLENHLEEECPLGKVCCQYCHLIMQRWELGNEPEGLEVDDLPKEQREEEGGSTLYSGHYARCPRMPLKCDFHHIGCTARVKRGDVEQHHAKFGRKHAQLVSRQLGWHKQTISWCIPPSVVSQARHSRRFIRESLRIAVGEYKVFLRITVSSGKVRLFLCLDSPDVPASVEDLRIVVGPGFVRMRESASMQVDESGSNIWSMGGTLVYKNDDNEELFATTDNLLSWTSFDDNVQNAVFVKASFRLQRPNSVTSYSTTGLTSQSETFWNNLGD